MYYQGDYYRGDYYQGDPFWGALVGGAIGLGKKLFGRSAKKTVGTALMRAGGGGGLGAGITGGLIAKHAFGSTGFGGPRGLQQRPPFERGPIRRAIERTLPGGRTGYEVDCKPGQYMQVKNKVPTGKCLYRKMNVTNSRALRRSLRRVAGFGKLASRARRDVRRAATAIGATSRRAGPVARHHAKIRRAA